MTIYKTYSEPLPDCNGKIIKKCNYFINFTPKQSGKKCLKKFLCLPNYKRFIFSLEKIRKCIVLGKLFLAATAAWEGLGCRKFAPEVPLPVKGLRTDKEVKLTLTH